MHRVRAFRAVRAEPRPQRLPDGKDEIPHPGHRQIGQNIVSLAQLVESGRGFGCLDNVAVAQHHTLGLTRGARGIKHDARAVVVQLGLTRLKLFDVLVARLAAHVLNGAILVQRGVVVFAQTAWIKIDHTFELGQLVLNIQHLVDLFLIAHDGKTRATMIQHIGHLFGVSVLIQRHRHGTDHLCGHHGPIEIGTIAADDGDKVTLVRAQLQQAKRKRLDLVAGLCPRPALPDAIFLFAIRRRVRKLLCITMQQRRNRLRSVGAHERVSQMSSSQTLLFFGRSIAGAILMSHHDVDPMLCVNFYLMISQF